MRQLPKFPLRIQFGVRGWAVIAVAVAIFATFTFLAIGIFVLFLPVLLIAPILFWFLPKPKLYPIGPSLEKPRISDATVIDGDFSVVGRTLDNKSKPPRRRSP
jgi:hypothetical protein